MNRSHTLQSLAQFRLHKKWAQHPRRASMLAGMEVRVLISEVAELKSR